jgi:fructose-1,6-bisphosphatase/inositol monophosphatase family enzyme
LNSAYVWAPTDGTTNFVHGLALTCVLVGFLVDGIPTVGVTYDPLADELFTAIRGRGAFWTTASGDTRPMRVSGTTDLQTAVVSMDAGYGREAADVQRYIAVQQAVLLKRVRHVRVLGCCGYVS